MAKFTSSTTEFGKYVSALLKSRDMTQDHLAAATGMSQPYTNQVVNGRKTASARWADLVADALKLSPDERAKLHAAAAKDNGFKIELPPFAES
jgi:transcriptional regulator with XRE-family HTH domain